MREPIQIIEIDVDGCSRTFGVGGCTAALGADGDRKCWNTWATCRKRSVFAHQKARWTLRFCEPRERLPKTATYFPVVQGVSEHSATVNIAGADPDLSAFGKRATVKVDFLDFPYHDRLTDPYWSERVSGAAQIVEPGYDPFERGSFFGKLKARWPTYATRPMRVINAWLEDDGTITDAVTRSYVITDMSGPDSDGRVSFEAADVLDLAKNDRAVAPIRARHVETDLDKLPPNPANARIKAWRLLFRTAKRRGLVQDDPTAGVNKRAAPTEGHIAWSADEIATFRDHHKPGTVARACFELVLWTGARTCDAVRLGRANIDGDGLLTFRQTKTGGLAYVPWSSPLPPWASGWAAEREGVRAALECLSGGFTFLEAQGRVRSIKGLGNVISAAAREAGLTRRTAHGLRKSRLTMIAEAGGTAHAIMAWGGHKSLSEVQRYTLAAEKKRLVLGNETNTERCITADTDTKSAAK